MKIILLMSLMAALASMVWSAGNMDLESLSHQCIAETKVTEKEVDEFYSSDAKFNAGSPSLQCHLKCVMEKLGEFKNGALDIEKMIINWKEIPELAQHKVSDPKVLNECKDEKGANDCETAFKIHKCIRKSKAAK